MVFHHLLLPHGVAADFFHWHPEFPLLSFLPNNIGLLSKSTGFFHVQYFIFAFQ
jgi:hypothetical protein